MHLAEMTENPTPRGWSRKDMCHLLNETPQGRFSEAPWRHWAPGRPFSVLLCLPRRAGRRSPRRPAVATQGVLEPSGDRVVSRTEGIPCTPLSAGRRLCKEAPSTPAFLIPWRAPGHVAMSSPITGEEEAD